MPPEYRSRLFDVPDPATPELLRETDIGFDFNSRVAVWD